MIFKKKYSIILPVRNGGEYVKECVASILQQTLSEFNLVVLDNFSSDGTKEWIESLKDDRIIVCSSNRSLSIEDNWARILTVSMNEFITIIGHDDLFTPDYLKTMDELIDKFPKASLYQTHFDFINSEGRVIQSSKRMAELYMPSDFCTAVLKRDIDISGTGFMCRSEDYKEVGGIPLYTKLLFSDYALWLSLSKKSFVAVHPKNCSSFRVHNNISQTTNHVSYLNALGQFVEGLKEQMKHAAYFYPIAEYAPDFIKHYSASLANKLLRLKEQDRSGYSVKRIFSICNKWCNSIGNRSFGEYLPSRLINYLALIIDSNAGFRAVFRQLRKMIVSKNRF